MHDIPSSFEGATIFLSIDIRKAYHQTPMEPKDVEKAAIITRFGLDAFIKMPFGL